MQRTPDVDQGLIRHALQRGFLSPLQLREAVLLQDELAGAGRPTPLLHVLATRYLSAQQLAELRRIHADAQSAASSVAPWAAHGSTELPASLLLSSAERARAAPSNDPDRVRSILVDLLGSESTSPDGWGARLFAGAADAIEEPKSLDRMLGPYELRGELARGGMGIVYRAHHPALGQDVALKVLGAGLLASRQQLTRFLVEARAAARLRHPHIVSVHDVGEDQGQHYYVMDLVKGESLDDRLDREERIPPREAVSLSIKIARALHYAHGEGVIHRDMKPNNVMLTQEGEPLVTDFGLAKQLDHDLMLTAAGQTLGTPGFMPPEQVLGELERVDARSDVYSLGATLFAMLTGKLPVVGDDAFSVMRGTVVTRARSLRSIRPELDLDLEFICARCLAKDPEERYADAAALARDLEAYLEDRPIEARAVDVGERARKWIRRNRRLAVGGILTVATVVVVASGAAAFHLRSMRESLHREEASRVQAERERGVADEREAEARASARTAKEAEARAQRARVQAQRATSRALSAREAERSLLGRALAERARRILSEGQPHQAAALFARSLQLHEHALARTGLAVCLPSRWRWRWDSPRPIPSYALAYSPAGDLLAVGTGLSVEVYSFPEGRVIRSLPGHHRRVTALAFDRQGQHLASVSRDGAAWIWTLDRDSRSRSYRHSGHLLALAWDDESERVAVAGADGRVVVLSAATAKVEATVQAHEGAVRGVAFTAKGDVASGGEQGVRLWRGDEAVGALAQGRPVLGLARVGERLAVLTSQGVGLYTDGETEAQATRAVEGGTSLAVNGQTLAVLTPSGVSLLGAADEADAEARVIEVSPPASAVALSGSPPRVAVGRKEGFEVYETERGVRVARTGGHDHPLTAALIDRERKRLVVADRGGTIRFWRLRDGAPVGQIPKAHEGGVHALALSGSLLFSAGADRQLRVWNMDGDGAMGARALGEGEPGALSAARDGRVALGVGRSVIVLQRKGPGLQSVARLDLGKSVQSIAWSPDGRWVACANGNAIELWDPKGNKRRALRGHKGLVADVCFGPKGELLSVGHDGTLRLWSSEPESRVLAQHPSKALCLAISPDGRHVATGSWDAAHVWNRAGQSLARFKHPDPVRDVVFAADGSLFSCGGDWRVRSWEPRAGATRSYPARGTLLKVDRSTGQACGGGPKRASWLAPLEDLEQRLQLSPEPSVYLGRVKEGWVTCSSAGRLRFWSADGTALRDVQLKDVQRVLQVAVDAAGERALAWGSRVVERPEDPGVQVMIEGKLVTRYLRRQVVEQFELARGERLSRAGLAMPISPLTFVPGEAVALWGGPEGVAQFFDLASGKETGTLARHEGKHAQVAAIAFSPNQEVVATAGSDRSIRLWDLRARRQLAVLWGHRGLVQSLAFSPDGRLLASGGEDRTLRLWDVERRAELAILGGAGPQVLQVAFASPTRLLSCDAKGTLTTWDLAALGTLTPPDELVERVWRETGYRCLNMNARHVSNALWSE